MSLHTVRKIILQLSMSLDGYFEGPGRELDWHQVDDELHQHLNDVLARLPMFIDGRVNYELMAGYWPHADEDPKASAPEREFARIWRDMPKIAYSRTLQPRWFAGDHRGWELQAMLVRAESMRRPAAPSAAYIPGGTRRQFNPTTHVNEGLAYVSRSTWERLNNKFPPHGMGNNRIRGARRASIR